MDRTGFRERLKEPVSMRLHGASGDLYELIRLLEWSHDDGGIVPRAVRWAITRAVSGLKSPKCPYCGSVLQLADAGVYVCPLCQEKGE